MNDANPNFGDQLDYEPKVDPETGRELLPNPERGCGYLQESKGYIRTDPVRGPDGVPAFVTFDQPVPYKEGTLRSYQNFDGLGFQRSLDSEQFSTVPEDDLSDLWDRLEDSEDGTHWGAITTAYAEDMLMWVGETYYDDPRDFVEEARKFGLSKAIPVSKRQGPPAINPMCTRVFLVHPTAYRVYEQTTTDGDDEADGESEDDDENTEKVRVSYLDDDNRLGEDDAEKPLNTIAGVIGYSYLTRVVWTAPTDDDIPKWAKQYEDTGQLDIVDVGEPVAEDEVDERLAEYDGQLSDEGVNAQQIVDALSEAGDTLSPGHGATLDDVDDAAAGDDPDDADDTEADSDRSEATDEDPEAVVPSDRDNRDVEAVELDDLTYNQLKAVASRLDADVSAQPPGEELKDAIRAQIQPGQANDVADVIVDVYEGN